MAINTFFFGSFNLDNLAADQVELKPAFPAYSSYVLHASIDFQEGRWRYPKPQNTEAALE